MELQSIQSKIYEIRGVKVMLDYDLAGLYEVETRVLNQSVRRNCDIFPDDFMFRLSKDEWEKMSSQIVMTSSPKRPKSSPPLAFTEYGVIMLANILKSRKAKSISITIVRAFVALKHLAFNYKELSEKLEELEAKYDMQFEDIYEAINYLLKKDKQEIEQSQRRRIGFLRDNETD